MHTLVNEHVVTGRARHRARTDSELRVVIQELLDKEVNGFEVMVRKVAPEIANIVDMTDHAMGTKPYYERIT